MTNPTTNPNGSLTDQKTELAFKDNTIHKPLSWDEVKQQELQAELDEIKELYKTGAIEAGTPTLEAFEDERGYLQVFCPYCVKIHRHGRGYGHRVAHCFEDGGNRNSPFDKTGYVLVPPKLEHAAFHQDQFAKQLREWRAVNLWIFSEEKATDQQKRAVAVEYIMKMMTLKTIKETGDILYHEDGTYKPFAEHEIHSMLVDEAMYGGTLQPGTKEAILDVIRGKTGVKRSEFDKDINIINLKNGLYNIKQGKLYPHDPAYLSVRQKPFSYNPEAQPKQWLKFLQEILYPQDIRTAIEAVAYTFLRDNPFENYFVLVGIGRNGKTKFTGVMTALHGEDNVSKTPLSLMMAEPRFALSGLEGKDLNIDTELSSATIKDMAVIKRLTTTQTKLRVERKHEHEHEARIYAKLFFNANKIPETDDDSDAHYAREIIITFPNQFLGKNADPNILEKLTTEDELSGIFNVCMKVLPKLLANGGIYQQTKSIEERRVKSKRIRDPIAAFIEEGLLLLKDGATMEDKIITTDLHAFYVGWCRRLGLPFEKEQPFTEKIRKIGVVGNGRKEVDGKSKRAFSGVKLRTELLQLLGVKLGQLTIA